LTRRSTALAVVVSLAPLWSGCVSAVDESTAFGFNGSAPTETAAAPGTEKVAGTEGDAAEPTDTAEAQPSTDPAGGADKVADASASAPPSSATTSAASAGPALAAADAPSTSGPLINADRAPVAAYAGASVGAVSEGGSVAKAGAPKADTTLFASLFAQSEAKTPVRNADSGKSRRVILKPEGAPAPVAGDVTTLASLPGVKSRASLFEIGQRASADYDADILDEASGDQDSYQLASLGGMARLAPSGLMVQRPDVQTNCFDSKLVAMLRAVETRFNTKVVVTSGYRSPTHNRAVRGAKASMHMSCKAADILVPGADKLQVANFVRSLPGRGGVGTYCHTSAIHVDTGRERDWSWTCRRRRT
jgi:uncharacterized protein YcbK (DUF882 family)